MKFVYTIPLVYILLAGFMAYVFTDYEFARLRTDQGGSGVMNNSNPTQLVDEIRSDFLVEQPGVTSIVGIDLVTYAYRYGKTLMRLITMQLDIPGSPEDTFMVNYFIMGPLNLMLLTSIVVLFRGGGAS